MRTLQLIVFKHVFYTNEVHNSGAETSDLQNCRVIGDRDDSPLRQNLRISAAVIPYLQKRARCRITRTICDPIRGVIREIISIRSRRFCGKQIAGGRHEHKRCVILPENEWRDHHAGRQTPELVPSFPNSSLRRGSARSRLQRSSGNTTKIVRSGPDTFTANGVGTATLVRGTLSNQLWHPGGKPTGSTRRATSAARQLKRK